MLRSIKSINGFHLKALDGEIGHAADFYFDDENWIIRYLIVETGNWLIERRVLLSPKSFLTPNWESKEFPIKLYREQIENSPDVAKHKPVSKQNEAELARYYEWPIYWPSIWHATVVPHITKPASADAEDGNPHLRSINEVSGYHIQASDGDIGHVDDFIIDDQSWKIRYLVIATKNILPGKKVLISPKWVKEIDWQQEKLHSFLTIESIKNSPEFDPTAPVNRSYEEKLYDYYGRPAYWQEEAEKAAIKQI